MQVVGDEGMRRAQPHLIDRSRFLQLRQRVARAGPSADTGFPAATGCARFPPPRGRAGADRARAPPSSARRASSKRSSTASAAPSARSGSAEICRGSDPPHSTARLAQASAASASPRASATRARPAKIAAPRPSCRASGSIPPATISSGSASSQRRRSICARAKRGDGLRLRGQLAAGGGERHLQRPPAQRRSLLEIAGPQPVLRRRFEHWRRRRTVRVRRRRRRANVRNGWSCRDAGISVARPQSGRQHNQPDAAGQQEHRR